MANQNGCWFECVSVDTFPIGTVMKLVKGVVAKELHLSDFNIKAYASIISYVYRNIRWPIKKIIWWEYVEYIRDHLEERYEIT